MADTWTIVGGVSGVAGAVFALVALIQAYRKSPNDVRAEIREYSEARLTLARRLRGGRFGRLYPDLLERGLGALDRLFGPAGSWDALGVCYLMALCYAFAAFVLGWAFLGTPGTIGDLRLLPRDVDSGGRALLAMALVGLPPIAFFLGRRLGRQERRLKDWLRVRWPVRGFELAYRLASGVAAGSLAWGLWVATENQMVASGAWWGGSLAIGPALGIWIARKSSRRPIQWLV